MINRRELFSGSAALYLSSKLGVAGVDESLVVNDVHSQLNSTRVNRILKPNALEDIQAGFRAARREEQAVSVAGGRHAMGGQQFGRDTVLLDAHGSA